MASTTLLAVGKRGGEQTSKQNKGWTAKPTADGAVARFCSDAPRGIVGAVSGGWSGEGGVGWGAPFLLYLHTRHRPELLQKREREKKSKSTNLKGGGQDASSFPPQE